MDKIIVRSKKKLIEEICNVLKTDGNSADLNHIDVSRITDMSGLFWNSKFNGDMLSTAHFLNTEKILM
jgi:hypothetical protein